MDKDSEFSGFYKGVDDSVLQKGKLKITSEYGDSHCKRAKARKSRLECDDHDVIIIDSDSELPRELGRNPCFSVKMAETHVTKGPMECLCNSWWDLVHSRLYYTRIANKRYKGLSFSNIPPM